MCYNPAHFHLYILDIFKVEGLLKHLSYQFNPFLGLLFETKLIFGDVSGLILFQFYVFFSLFFGLK